MLTSPSTVLCVHLLCTALLVRGLDSNQLDHEQAACLPCAMYDAHLHLQLGDDTVAKLWKIHCAGGEQASVLWLEHILRMEPQRLVWHAYDLTTQTDLSYSEGH